ncbi:MAG: hypothetical protein OEM77_04675 [Nitrosopumilus sp.]|nr:hypothetical protein [Nitrosopumilus sp.]MDH3737389.1 hypothetical protein [Nitrosopumilus sp.]MDH3823609.1 hypothetical protein [Nitrosopumilus sp.]MDH3834551.1 hypothetical protein [Nitrosopumilus sp.]
MLETSTSFVRIRVCEKCGYKLAEVIGGKWNSEDIIFCPHCQDKPTKK